MSFSDKRKKIVFYAVLVIAAAAAAFGLYRFGSPTHVGMINYPEYMLAENMDQKINPMVRITPVKWSDKTSPDELRKYDVLYFFGMGLQFSGKQQEQLDALIKRGVPVYVTASTRAETRLNTLTEAQTKNVAAYMGNGGKENFRQLMNYTRYAIHGRRLFAEKPLPPKHIPSSAFFHTDENAVFTTYAEYLKFYKESGRYNGENPTVCILSGNGGGDLKALVAALEKRNINVVGVSGMMRRLSMLEEIKPDLIIYQPHGRLSMNDPDAAVAALKKYNIPLFCPIKVSQPYHEYLKDQRGMTGGMLSQSVTMPELDGGAVPFVLSALYPNARGLQEFRIIPDRLERFCTMVRKTLDLKRKPNSEKKIVIIYYKGPGKNAMNAGGIEVGDSLLNTLKHLQKAGFTTGALPETPAELNRMVQEQAAVFGTYAEGAVSEFIKKGNPELISEEEYLSWVRKSLPADLFESVEKQYGKFPGKYLSVERDGKPYLVLGKLQFGNIVLMPQGLPAYGEDTNKLIHGVKQAPPLSYLATYLWLRHKFNADVLMHFGTHGSLEFTPWKQVALSSYDWPDVLIGEMPHYYLYVINNPGEALIAKRRSYATMVSHLTAPFMNSGSYGPLAELEKKIDEYETAESEMLREEYRKSIIASVKKEKIDQDIKFSPEFAKGKLTDGDLERLHEHLHEIGGAKVNRGLYVIGRPYSKEQADETALLMSVDHVADQLFKEDVKRGRVKEEQRDKPLFYDANYIRPARKMIEEAFRNPPKETAKKPEVPGKKTAFGAPMSPEAMKKALESMPPAMRAAFEQMTPEERSAAMKMFASGMRPAGMGRGGRSRGMRMGRMPEKPKFDPIQSALRVRRELIASTQYELDSIVNAFSGGYLAPSPGGDPVGNPDTVPTGRNLYGIDPERTPTKESYAVGKKLGEALIAAKLKSTGKYPEKVAFTLWGGEFIRSKGTNIGEIFFLLGVEPVWDSRGRVQDVRLIPDEVLRRPRIDVLVQTSGQFRGAATSRMRLIDKAVKLAGTAPKGQYDNFVRKGSETVIRELIAGGMSPEQAKSLADARIFGGVNGNFGTGVTGMVQSGDKWEDSKVIADLYLNNMGALYTEDHWGESIPGVFKAAMQNTDTVVQPRSSNSWGPLSLDHVYEFMGGMNLAVKNVTGKEPDTYFNDLRTPGRARIQEAGEAAMVEARSTVLNPKYLKEMMKEGPGGAGTFAEVLRNSYGWKVMKPDMLKDHLFDEYKAVFVDDKYNLDMKKYFESKNPYALQEITAVMMETARKGLWKTDAATLRQLAELHAELVKNHGAACSGFVCNNAKLKEFIDAKLSDVRAKQSYNDEIRKVRTPSAAPASAQDKKSEQVEGMKLKEQVIQQEKTESKLSRRNAVILLISLVVLVTAAFLIGKYRRRAEDR